MKELGAVSVNSDVVDVTLSLDTSAYADGDLLADVQKIDNILGQKGSGTIVSVTVIDEDDQGQGFDLFFTGDDTSWGTENSALAVADAQIREVQAVVNVASGDYTDLVNGQVAFKNNINALVKASSDGLYVAAVSRGTGTYTASGLKLKIGIIRD